MNKDNTEVITNFITTDLQAKVTIKVVDMTSTIIIINLRISFLMCA